MYCLDCAKAGTKGTTQDADPELVLRVLRDLARRGDTGARRLFFGILWDEGRSILCYRCKRRRPVRLNASQRDALGADAEARPSSAGGEKGALGVPAPHPAEGSKRAA